MPPPAEGRSSGIDDDVGRETLAAVEWTAEDREDNWLISYADLLSVIFTMVVLLFGRMTVVAEQPAVEPAAPEPVAEIAAAPDAPPTVRIVSSPATPQPAAEAMPEPRSVAEELGASADTPPDP